VTTVAVIQPYFFPYPGYFRLFAAADTVVMFDCVQFPRRGWVHRNRFTLASGELDWLTLPIEKADRDASIDALQFQPQAGTRLRDALHRFPLLDRSAIERHPLVDAMLATGVASVASYLVGLVEATAQALTLHKPMVRSSSLNIDPNLHGQDRVVAIASALGATRYVNPSGGRELYDHAAFEKAGMELRFLTPYAGAMDSTLTRILADGPQATASEIVAQTILER
jgi:hypothetical protein